MNALSVLPATALLVSAVFCARPAADGTMRRWLLFQGVMLAIALLSAATIPGSMVGVAFLCGECVWLWLRAARGWEKPESGGIWPIGVALAAAWIGFRLLPSGSGSAASPVLSAGLGIVLSGAVGLVFARSERSRWAALLTAGHGALLMICVSPGGGWLAWPMVVVPQLLFLQRFCARPVWSDPV